MFERRSLRLPITLGVAMIVMLVVLIVGWILLAVFGAMRESQHAPAYWTVLSIGSAMFVLVLVGVVVYLVLTIKAINLNRRQTNFVDSVTHELKSPIASLKLGLQTLNRRTVNEEQQETFVSYMLDDIERLDSLITRLLIAGNIDARSREEGTETIDLAQLVTELAEAAAQRAGLPADAIRLNLRQCEVVANRIDLDMIIRNLIDNAIKYGGEPLSIAVGLDIEPQEIRLTVDDNGPGIPRGQRNRVFGRFVRLGSELERRRTGTGLGLYIVRTLVERLGGTISVIDGPMSGARLDVRFPRSMLLEPATGVETARDLAAS
jgi:signal transduction histidine kinase